MPQTTLLQPEERVLSTLNKDGSRRWLKPKPSRGGYWRARRAVAYILIAVFVALPLIRINGRPAILLDIARREFTFFGKVFLPTDTLLMALLMLGVFLTIFLATALFGRVWCGWACPQTVYMEFVFRPIERLLDGEPGRSKATGPRKAAKFFLYAIISVGLAHVFLSYFVGWERLSQWVFGSPFKHLAGFLTVAFVSVMMLFDFAFFREQTCIVACPYGRFQSVLLDRQSTIVAYDTRRGEPRGKNSKAKAPKSDVRLVVLPNPGVDMATPSAARTADCVDCTLCVQTCPTGIDIRDGLQMECINCAQCIDACDAVMTKLGRPTGLIRYASEDEIEGKPTPRFRPRLALYPAALVIVFSAFVALLITARTADVTLLRARGTPYSALTTGEIANTLRVKITNRTDEPRDYRITVEDLAGLRLDAGENPLRIEAGQTREEPMLVIARPDLFRADGRRPVIVTVTDGADYTQTFTYGLLGPVGAAP